MITQPKNRRNKQIENSYIHDIAQLTDLSSDKVKEVFSYYALYILHEIAIKKKPKKNIEINLPCFCSLIVAPNNYPKAKNKLKIYISSDVRDNHLKEIIENAYFHNKDYLIEHLTKLFSENLANDILQKDLDDE